MRRAEFLIFSLFLAVSLGWAGEADPAPAGALATPVLGYVAQADPLRLQPVVGMQGAALLGDAIALPAHVTRLTVSPGQGYGLAETDDGQPLGLLKFSPAGAGASEPIAGAAAHADRIEFSPRGGAAVLYAAETQRVQVVVNLPEAPRVASEFDAARLGSALTALALSDDGATVLAGVSDGEKGGLFKVGADGSLARLGDFGQPVSIRFLLAGDQAVVADGLANQVTLLDGVSGSPTFRMLAGPDQGVSGPTQMEVLSGDAFAVLSGAGGGAWMIDLKAGGCTAIPGVSSAGMVALGGRTAVAMSDGAGAFWLVGRNAGGPRITFVAEAAKVTQ